MLCERSLKSDIDDLVASIMPGVRYAVIDDAHTGEALGERISRALKTKSIRLKTRPIADQQTVDEIRNATQSADMLVAVGSGTISDLCKYASFLDNKPYIVFPTAASMNGYLSANASITVNGYKKTLQAHMPKAVFCDLSVIAATPSRLNKSGLGDSLARSTAQADWLLSHLLLGMEYKELPFELLRPLEPVMLENARGIAKGNPDAIKTLLETLLLSGLGMTFSGGSYPASQGEHMIAHAYEMIDHAQHRAGLSPKPSAGHTFHGEEIGVTALHMARLQQQLLRKTPVLQSLQFPEDMIRGVLGEAIGTEALGMYSRKRLHIERVALDDDRLRQIWPEVAARIEKIILPPETIKDALQAAEAPEIPEAIGWQRDDYNTALTHARFLRDRFTFLDLE